MSPEPPAAFSTTSPVPPELVLVIFAAGKLSLVAISSCAEPGLVPIATLPPLKNESPEDLIFTISVPLEFLNLYKGLLLSNSVTAKPLPVLGSALKA